MAAMMMIRRTDRSPLFDFVGPYKWPQLFQDPLGLETASGLFVGKEKAIREPPLAARQVDTKKLCDAFWVIGEMCVSAKFMDIVENLEPNRHQFLPIQLLKKDGSLHSEQYFIFNPLTIIDAYVGTSGYRWDEAGGPGGVPYFMGYRNEGMTVSRPEIDGRHVWIGHFQGRQNTHISDALQKALEKAKVRYAEYYYLTEVDVDWRPEVEMLPALRWLERSPARIRDMVLRRPDWVRRHRPQWM